jgi:transcriptional regulator with XRE-family HTH domain
MFVLMQSATPQDATGDNGTPPSDFSDAVFARRLRDLREASGLTQQQLADVMASTGNKIHRSTIGKIESGDRPVTVGEAAELAGILGVGLAELVTDPGLGPGPHTVEQVRQHRAHRARVEAEVRVRGLHHEAERRRQDLAAAQARYDDAMQSLEQARQRLSGLGKGDR